MKISSLFLVGLLCFCFLFKASEARGWFFDSEEEKAKKTFVKFIEAKIKEEPLCGTPPNPPENGSCMDGSYSYDIQKTNSTVTPYRGFVTYGYVYNHCNVWDVLTKGAAPSCRITKNPEHLTPITHNYYYRNGKWE